MNRRQFLTTASAAAVSAAMPAEALASGGVVPASAMHVVGEVVSGHVLGTEHAMRLSRYIMRLQEEGFVSVDGQTVRILPPERADNRPAEHGGQDGGGADRND